MKKNFFKKLSFVLALAMIMSVIAPAAGAFAAVKPKLSASTKYLHVDKDGYANEYNFNITTKKGKGWTYEWTSSKESVATVNEKNGVVTAVAAGTTTIKVVITDADGEEVGTASAKVVVRDNIKALEIYTKDAADLNKVAVGADVDFNRYFTTDSGATNKGSKGVTGGVTRWTVNATEDKATITDSGVFNAKVAGEYKITARSFQSVDKYNAWKDDNTLNYVTATAEVTVKVVVALKEVKLVTPKQMTLTFDSSVKDVVKAAADVKVNLKLENTTNTAMVPVWSFDSISADGKVVTISTYDNLIDKKTYTVTAAGASAELYAQIGSPVSISMVDQTIPADTTTTVAYSLIDQYGVDVKSIFGGSVVKNSSIPWYLGAAGELRLTNDQLAFVEYNYTILNADGSSTVISTGTKTVKGVAATINGALEWNVYTSEDFSKTTKTVKAGDLTQNIYGRVKKTDNSYTLSSTYKFISMSESILMIDAADNSLIPIAAGTALVKVVDVTNSDALVAYINVEVTAAPATASIKASATTVKLSNSVTFNGVASPESTTVTITKLDQYATETAANVQESYVINTGRTTDLAAISVTGNSITFTAVAGKAGTFNYYVKAADKTLTVTVTVATPGVLNSYVIEADQTSIDNYVANADTASTVNFAVYGVDATGTKKEKVSDRTSVSGVAVTYNVKNGDGTVVESGTFDGSEDYSVTDLDGVEKVGTYTINVSIGGIVVSKSFAVTNSRTAPVATIKALATTATTSEAIESVVADLIGLKIGDTPAAILAGSVKFQSANSALIATNGASFSATPGTVRLFITEVATNAGGVTQTVAINAAFTVTVQ